MKFLFSYHINTDVTIVLIRSSGLLYFVLKEDGVLWKLNVSTYLDTSFFLSHEPQAAVFLWMANRFLYLYRFLRLFDSCQNSN